MPVRKYPEERLTGTCEANYSLVVMYTLCDVARAFDPNFAAGNVTAAFIDRMSAITALRTFDLLDSLKRELPTYLASAKPAPAFNKSSVDDYTTAVLTWWPREWPPVSGMGVGRANCVCHLPVLSVV